jgi:hypothetical protein
MHREGLLQMLEGCRVIATALRDARELLERGRARATALRGRAPATALRRPLILEGERLAEQRASLEQARGLARHRGHRELVQRRGLLV